LILQQPIYPGLGQGFPANGIDFSQLKEKCVFEPNLCDGSVKGAYGSSVAQKKSLPRRRGVCASD
jgi:hypothetical protein